MPDARLRAFIAVPVPSTLHRPIARVIDALRKQPGGDRVRWVRAENLHVTLRFLGKIDPDIIPTLLERVGERTAQHEAFELTLAHVQLFPSQRRPSVVAFELAPAEPLTRLAEAVEQGVVAAGLPGESRPFRSHLTLGRIRERHSALDVTASDTALSDSLPVTEAILFQSELRKSGAFHTPLAQVWAAASAPSAVLASPLHSSKPKEQNTDG